MKPSFASDAINLLSDTQRMTKKITGSEGDEALESASSASTDQKPPDVGAKGKRARTGGKTRLTIGQRIELARQRSQIAELNDETTLDSQLAALFLGISEKKLEELRKPPRFADKNKFPRLAFLKIFDDDARGRNQPNQYKLGALKEYQREISVTDTFQASVRAGLASWVSVIHPFFVQKSEAGYTVVLADAWDMHAPNRDVFFESFLRGEVDIEWMSSANAALAIWKDPTEHQVFVSQGINLLVQHKGEMEFAISRSRDVHSLLTSE